MLFPDECSLCESCGYALRGLAGDGGCPECGEPIRDSHPHRRWGPAWQNGFSPAAAWRTVLALPTRPNVFFRTMRVDGANFAPRVYLLGVACLTGLIWAIGEWWALRQPLRLAAGYGLLVVASFFVLAYIEVLGVAYFSRRRGWRVPVHLAERIACYASPGLMLAALLLFKLRLLLGAGVMPLPAWMQGVPWLWVVPLGVSIFGFEMLVWMGVRRCKYANAPV